MDITYIVDVDERQPGFDHSPSESRPRRNQQSCCRSRYRRLSPLVNRQSNDVKTRSIKRIQTTYLLEKLMT